MCERGNMLWEALTKSWRVTTLDLQSSPACARYDLDTPQLNEPNLKSQLVLPTAISVPLC